MLALLQTRDGANAEFDASARNCLQRRRELPESLLEPLWRPLRLVWGHDKTRTLRGKPSFLEHDFPDSCKADPRLTGSF